MTNFFVGDHGANVPLPTRMNEEMQSVMIVNPKRIIADPKKTERRMSAVQSFSIHDGTMTNTVIGRIKENICFNTSIIIQPSSLFLPVSKTLRPLSVLCMFLSIAPEYPVHRSFRLP